MPGREGEQAGEEPVGEGGQERLAVLARLRDARELERLEGGLARRDRRVVLGHADRAGDLEELVDRVGGDPQHPVDPAVARLVGVQPEGIPGAGREVGRPVRVGQLPGLVPAEQVVGQLLRRGDERVVPGQVQQEDVLERSLGHAALVERDDPVAAGVAAGRPELGRVLGQDQVAPRTVPAEDVRQLRAGGEVRVEQGPVAVHPLGHRRPGILDRGGQAVRDGRQPVAGAVHCRPDGRDLVARGCHQLDQPAEQRGVLRIGGLGLLDRDEPIADGQSLVRRGEQVVGRGGHGVGTRQVGGRRLDVSGDRDQGVVLEEVLEVAQPCARGGEVAPQVVEGRPIDLQPGGLRPRGQRHEVRPQAARVVEGGQVANGGQQPGDGGQGRDHDQEGDREEDEAPTA